LTNFRPAGRLGHRFGLNPSRRNGNMDGKGKSRSRDLLDAASCRVPVSKIRELGNIKSTRLALEMFLGADPLARKDGHAGLFRICRRALGSYPYLKGGVFLPVEGFAGDDSYGPLLSISGSRRATDLFILEEMDKLCEAYKGRTRRCILLAALRGEFRYFPRRVRLKLIDTLRKTSSFLNRERRRAMQQFRTKKSKIERFEEI